MVRWETGRVVAHAGGWRGVVELDVEVDGAPDGGSPIRALAYTELVGVPAVGERVHLNTNALRRRLGTGGTAMVVARRDAAPAAAEAPGHLVKARYTPLQTMVDAIDDPASAHYATVSGAQSLESMPVVVADLHSSLPAVIAGIRADSPRARIVYVMSDGAALPAAYSRTVAALREHGLLTACISAGQAFGGDAEAVTVHSALLGARHVYGADVAIVIQGPGNLGTGTGWGFSGVQAGEALNAAGTLGGRPIGALRVSAADPRGRHRGLSHHSATAYGRVALVPATFPVRDGADPGYSRFDASVREEVETTIVGPAADRGIAHLAAAVKGAGLDEALRALPVRLSTMGRSLEDDPAAFLYAALAGRCAAAPVAGS